MIPRRHKSETNFVFEMDPYHMSEYSKKNLMDNKWKTYIGSWKTLAVAGILKMVLKNMENGSHSSTHFPNFSIPFLDHKK